MPFSDTAGGISEFLKAIGQRDLIEPQPGLVGDCIELMPESRWVSTRQEPRPRRAAIRCRNIALGEPYTVCSQCVDVGGRDLLVAIATCLPPALIIRVKDQQVWFGRLLSLRNPKVSANQARCNRAAKCGEW